MDGLLPGSFINPMTEIRSQPTERQLQVIQLLAEGYRTHDVAAALNLTPWTVKAYIREAMHTLAAKNRTHLVAKCWRRCLID